MSRAFLADKPGILEEFSKLADAKNRITFKKHSIDGELFFGKTTGIDTLKGKDLNVMGTPHQPEFLYKLFAYTVGLHFNENSKMSYRPVRYNGMKFWFMTFDDEALREIQLWMIASELEQAVGRARPLREKCTVNVFSNYPLPQSIPQKLPQYILYKYAKDKEVPSMVAEIVTK
jgi:hypothetical protein